MCPVEVAARGLNELVCVVGEGADTKDLGEAEDDQPSSSDNGRLNLRARLEENAVTVMDTKGSELQSLRQDSSV